MTLKELRLNKGLTQMELARAIRSSVTSVSFWESGGRLSLRKRRELAEFFGVGLWAFCTHELPLTAVIAAQPKDEDQP